MENFSSIWQLVTLDLVDSSIGAMAKGLALVDVEASIAKDMLLSLNKHSMSHCNVANQRKTPLVSCTVLLYVSTLTTHPFYNNTIASDKCFVVYEYICREAC